MSPMASAELSAVTRKYLSFCNTLRVNRDWLTLFARRCKVIKAAPSVAGT